MDSFVTGSSPEGAGTEAAAGAGEAAFSSTTSGGDLHQRGTHC